jgi:hypothetical protein
VSLLLLIGAIILVVIVALLPVKIAASVVGARNRGFGACFLAVIVALLINGIFGHLFRYGFFIGALVTGLAYMWVLGTTYWRGVGIALLQTVITWLIGLLLAALGLVALAPWLGHGTSAATGGSWV